MVPSLARPSMVVVEAMGMEEDAVEDIMVEETMDTEEEVPMVVMEVNHPWVEGQEVAVVATTLPSGPTTIAAWA